MSKSNYKKIIADSEHFLKRTKEYKADIDCGKDNYSIQYIFVHADAERKIVVTAYSIERDCFLVFDPYIDDPGDVEFFTREQFYIKEDFFDYLDGGYEIAHMAFQQIDENHII